MKIAKHVVPAMLLLALCCISCVPSGRGYNTAASPSGFSGRFALALPEFGTPVTPEEIESAYAQYGAAAIVRKLHAENAANWNMIMNRIAAGDVAWIKCAAEFIIPGTDASATDDIVISFAYGLQTNPESVLAFLGTDPGISAEAVCSLPFIEPEPGFLDDYAGKAVAALRRVQKAALVPSRNECLRLLRENLARADGEYTAGRS